MTEGIPHVPGCPEILDSLAWYPYSDRLRVRFTTVSSFGDTVSLWKTSDDRPGLIGLPREVCPERIPASKDWRTDGQEVSFPDMKFEARNDEQTRFASECIFNLKAGKSFIARAFTGFGKTAVSMPVIAAIGRTTLVLVNKEDLIDRWKEDLVGILGMKPEEIGHVRQDTYDIKDKKVVIGMLHSVILPDRYPKDFADRFGLVIADETHVLGATTFSRAASMFKARLRLGLTATPYRKDGKDVVFLSHIGPVLVSTGEVSLKPKVLRYRTNWVCPRIMDKGKIVLMPHKAAKDGHVRTMMANHAGRNLMMSEWVAKSAKAGRNTVFFSDRLDHLDMIKALLLKRKVRMSDMGMYVGGMSEQDRRWSSTKPVILATYAMMSQGTNIPWLDTCVLGMPRSDVEQIVGRILREYPGKKTPVVFDPLDHDSPVYRRFSISRRRWYSKIGAQIKDMG